MTDKEALLEVKRRILEKPEILDMRDWNNCISAQLDKVRGYSYHPLNQFPSSGVNDEELFLISGWKTNLGMTDIVDTEALYDAPPEVIGPLAARAIDAFIEKYSKELEAETNCANA